MSVRDYSQYITRVIQWNDVAGKLKTSYSAEDINMQKERVLEEINETLDAIEKNDFIETKDGICDIFVTAAYLDFMINYKDSTFYKRYKKTTSTMYKPEYLVPAINKIKQAMEIDSYDKMAYYIFRMCESINCDIKKDLQLVLDNNDKKFLTNLDEVNGTIQYYQQQGIEAMYRYSEQYQKYAILRKSDNKVLKPKGFDRVELTVN